jgi:hypothetical protein
MGPSKDESSGGECGGCEYEGKMNAEGTVVCMGGTNHECTQHVYGGYFWNDQRTPCKESEVNPDIQPGIQGSDIDFPGSDIQDSESTPEQDSQESSGESEFENSGYGKENEYVS